MRLRSRGARRFTGTRALPTLIVAACVLSVLPSASAGYEVVTATLSRSDTVLEQDWDAYEIRFSGSGSVAVRLTSTNAVDFYVFTSSQYAQYADPTAQEFYTMEALQNAREFAYTTQASGRIVVIDNADISVSGASPTGDAPYTVSITYPTGGALSPGGSALLIAAAFLLVIIVVIVAVIALAARRRPAPPLVPPVAGPHVPGTESPPPPPSFGGTVWSTLSAPVAAPCPRCGTATIPDATFCAACGTRLKG